MNVFWNILFAIGLTSAAAMSVFYRVKFHTFSLYVYTTISMVFIYKSRSVAEVCPCPWFPHDLA